jgi:hypothetical protein
MPLVFLIAFLLLLAISCLIIYWIFKLVKRLKKAGYGKLAMGILAVIALFVFYSLYAALYPSEDLYKADFETGSGIRLPASAEFVAKTCDYPDLHGHYYEAALIRLSPADFRQLQMRLSFDSGFVPADESSGFFRNTFQWLRGKNIVDWENFSPVYRTERRKRFSIGFGSNNLVLFEKSP